MKKKIKNLILQLCNYFSETSDSEKISIHRLMTELTTRNIGNTVGEFLQFIKNDICSKVAH